MEEIKFVMTKNDQLRAYRYSRPQMRWFPLSLVEAQKRVHLGEAVDVTSVDDSPVKITNMPHPAPKVKPLKTGEFKVNSGSSNKIHTVSLYDDGSKWCTCWGWIRHRPVGGCRHMKQLLV